MGMEVGLFESWKNIGNQKLHESNLILLHTRNVFPGALISARK